MTIKEICEKHRLKQTELARHFKIPVRTVQDWYAEKRVPPEYVVDMLLKLLQNEKKKKYVWQEDLDNIIVCPSCRNQIDNIYVDCENVDDEFEMLEPAYCVYCGQHLDWTKILPYGVEETHE